MTVTEHLFVYGTLCRGASGALHPLLSTDTEYCCEASLPGKLYEIDGYPGAVNSPSAGTTIQGELYRLHHPQRLFQRLDAYEECSAHFTQPHEYRRSVETVTTNDGDAIKAWMYIYNHALAGRRLIPSGDYRRFKQQDKQT